MRQFLKNYFTVDYGKEILVSLAPKIWELVPDLIREIIINFQS